MSVFSINWLAVIVGVVLSMLSGSLWYNPKTFFPTWWKGIGKGDETPGGGKNMGLIWGLTILTSVFQVVGLAVILNVVAKAFGSVNIATGALTGALVWLFIIAPTNLTNKLFAGFPFKVWFIEAGSHLLNFVLFGALLGLWR
ncbi:MAG: hypothetical protein C0410_10625 [Anaerolinea sp.]|nr:hypothetical protein [Anaerolinea sp.]